MSVLDAGEAAFVTSGRVAIASALQHMKIGRGDKVLLPAYHCSSIVQPVLWAGATPVFYRIRPDTSVDLADIEARIETDTRLILVANYFGFPQDLTSVRALCDRHGLLLLEDCAHAFFGQCDGRPLGSFGDYAIASITKFFPVYDGGCLISSRHPVNRKLDSCGPAFELKSILNTLERGFAYRRLRPLRALLSIPLALKQQLWQRVVKRDAGGGNRRFGPGSADGGFDFEPAWVGRRSSLLARIIVGNASAARIARRRRQNYLGLQQALSGLPGCRPLHPVLPDGVVPYVLPIVVSEPDKVFPALKQAGVPVIRFAEFLWDGVDAGTCPVSVDLSRRVMQFPCHQELTAAELDWLVRTIRSIFLSFGHELATVSDQ